MIKDFVETSDIPFVQGKSIVGVDNQKRKTPSEKRRQKLKERIDSEKDNGIKRELRKGNILTIVEGSLDLLKTGGPIIMNRRLVNWCPPGPIDLREFIRMLPNWSYS